MEQVIYHHGQIKTFDPHRPQAEAMVVEAGKVLAIGSEQEILMQFGRARVPKVDLEGAHVYPGLVDSHMHLSALGNKLRAIDFTSCHSKSEMLQAIRERVVTARAGEWIIGAGWDEHRMGGEAPTLAELDEVSPHNPVFLSRICYHVNLVNRVAYQLAGVTEGQRDPEKGAFGRDERGQLNGWIYENAAEMFRSAQPPLTYQEKKEALRRGMREALSLGLTAVHTEDLGLGIISSVDELIRIYQELHEEGFYLRTHHLIYYPHLSGLVESGWRAGQGNEWFRLGAMKIFADGALGGRTALLSQPYADAPDTYGMAIHEQAELLHLTAQASEQQMPIAVHAIGDEATDRVLQAMERYPFASNQGVRLRHRLIHGQILRPDLIERIKRIEVAVDIQPRFTASDFPWVLERIGEERAPYAYAWKTLIEEGIHCAGGSDAPIEPLHPLWGIHAAVTRRRLEDEVGHPGYLPEQKLDRFTALRLFTLGSAYAAGEERERGSLAVGKWADFTVYDHDLFTTDPEEMIQARVLRTVVNGKEAFRDGDYVK